MHLPRIALGILVPLLCVGSSVGQIEWPLAKELQALTEKAEKGDPEAQRELGVYYKAGQGVLWPYKEALKWLRKAACGVRLWGGEVRVVRAAA
jgi:hypothetical protein